jgi:hypothetical protein
MGHPEIAYALLVIMIGLASCVSMHAGLVGKPTMFDSMPAGLVSLKRLIPCLPS